jgi:pyridoxamine 5'-phosphate oxidase family protein
MFSQEELIYLRQQQLARLATVDAAGQPTVDAVGFQFEGGRFYVGGIALDRSRKYRNIAAGNDRVSLIIDDILSLEPYQPRGIKVHGTAEIVHRDDGFFGPGEYFVITPQVAWSWGVIAPTFQEGQFAPHKISWTTGAPLAPTIEELQTESPALSRR